MIGVRLPARLIPYRLIFPTIIADCFIERYLNPRPYTYLRIAELIVTTYPFCYTEIAYQT